MEDFGTCCILQNVCFQRAHRPTELKSARLTIFLLSNVYVADLLQELSLSLQGSTLCCLGAHLGPLCLWGFVTVSDDDEDGDICAV